ncbi:MAG: hypothetical protein B7733_05510 [Myxococcales bacterium FL481]|nr:MAG: hypothetical protein B7733_05510 [Myxococcales bacterium FL481]
MESPTPSASAPEARVTSGEVFRLWWPLATSWLLMGAETPVLAAVVARMPDAEVNLAAYGSLVMPVALLIEAPIIMLLAASTALASSYATYKKLWRFMMVSGAALTVLHVLAAFTPLYDVIARDLVGVPEPVHEPGRIGLQLMTPWTWAIAHRRFNQGVLIRFRYARTVGVGTIVRLGGNFSALALGATLTSWSGIVVAAVAVSTGVVAEAVFAAWCVKPVVDRHLRHAPPETGAAPLDQRSFLKFYIPLALTPLMSLMIQPIGAAAMSRMPLPLLSLAAWPPAHGVLFLLRTAGLSFNEVVVTLVGRPGGAALLRRFAVRMAAVTSGIIALIAFTPLSGWWFRHLSGLPPELVDLCTNALLIGMLMPAYSVMQNLFQGTLVHARRTRGVTEAVALYLVLCTTLLAAGAAWSPLPGLYYALASFTIAGLSQTAWLWWRSHRLTSDLQP